MCRKHLRVAVRMLVASSTSCCLLRGAWAFLISAASFSSLTLSNCFLASLNLRRSLTKTSGGKKRGRAREKKERKDFIFWKLWSSVYCEQNRNHQFIKWAFSMSWQHILSCKTTLINWRQSHSFTLIKTGFMRFCCCIQHSKFVSVVCFIKRCTVNAAPACAIRIQPLSPLSLGIMGAADATWVLSLAVPEAEADNPHSKTRNCFLYRASSTQDTSCLEIELSTDRLVDMRCSTCTITQRGALVWK